MGAYFALDRFEECLEYAERSVQKAPRIQYFVVYRIVCLVQLGRVDEARAVARQLVERHPRFTVPRWSALTRAAQDARKSASIEQALRAAGLPAPGPDA